MKRTLFSLLTAVAVLLLGPMSARAGITWPSLDDLYTIQWDFVPLNPSSLKLNSDAGSAPGFATVTTSQDAFYTDSSGIVASNIKMSSSGTKLNPSLLASGGNFLLQATVYDRASGPSSLGQIATFAVNLGVQSNPITHAGARFGAGFSDLDITITALTPTLLTFASGDTINLQLDPKSRVDAANSSGQGSITGQTTFLGAGKIQSTPEPSSLLLGGFGLSLVGGAWWRKRRQAARL